MRQNRTKGIAYFHYYYCIDYKQVTVDIRSVKNILKCKEMDNLIVLLDTSSTVIVGGRMSTPVPRGSPIYSTGFSVSMIRHIDLLLHQTP